MRISGHAFLVTGGASGLGAATAEALVKAGALVTIADRNVEAGEALAARLGASAMFCATDVVSPESVESALTMTSQRGELRGVVNCAGIIAGGRVVGREGPHDLGLFEKVIQVNLIGAFNVLRLASAAMAKLPEFEEGERGVVVQTSSVAAYDGQIGQAAYSASKGGVASMTLPIARELAKLGVRVVSIAPGVFETPMVASLPDEARASLVAQALYPKRLGQPHEFAALALHIIENRMLNGATLRLDGALRMPPK